MSWSAKRRGVYDDTHQPLTAVDVAALTLAPLHTRASTPSTASASSPDDAFHLAWAVAGYSLSVKPVKPRVLNDIWCNDFVELTVGGL
jgi:hypothetical protein